MDKSNVTKICVDDFAIRKRKSYGTVMVDLITHRIIDLLPSRDSKDVKQWLSTFPNIELVARDGAVIYSSAVSKSHPNAVQVSDRFHLIKGLAEAINRIIIRLYPARLEIPNIQEVPKEVEVLYNTANRLQRIRFAQKKRAEGLTKLHYYFILRPKQSSGILRFQNQRFPKISRILMKDNISYLSEKSKMK